MNKFEGKTTGLITALDFKKTSVKISYWIMFFMLIIISLVSMFPPFWVAMSSLKSMEEFFSIPPTLMPKTIYFEKISETWNSLSFSKYYINSLMMLVGDLVFALVFNGICGYVLSMLRPKGSNFLMIVVLWTMMMPATLSMVPLFKTFLDLPIFHINITNSYLPMWIISAANCFYILMFKSFFDTIPKSYVEAARIDGCSNLKIFYKIILPMSKPILMVVSIFVVSGSWDNFFWPYLVLKDTKLYTVAVQLFFMKGFFPMDVQIVASFFAMIPPAIMFVLLQKHIMNTGNSTGEKG